MDDVGTEHLIELVEAHPVLWDRSREDHRERTKMRDAWMIICAQLRDDFETMSAADKKEFVQIIAKRWRNVRDQWLKWRNKHRNPLKYNPGTRAYRRKYVYHDQLQFLEKGMGDFDPSEMSQEEFFDHLTQNDTDMDQPEPWKETVPELLMRIKSSASTESLGSELGRETEEPEIDSEFVTEHEFLPDSDESLMKKRKRSTEQEMGISEEERHMMFFRSVIPYLKSFTERQILDFQMGVLQLVKTSMEPDPLMNDQ